MLCACLDRKYIVGLLKVLDTLLHEAMYVATIEKTQAKFVLCNDVMFLFLLQFIRLKKTTFIFLDKSYFVLLQGLALLNQSLFCLFSCSGELN
jgi:hypothetical protein